VTPVRFQAITAEYAKLRLAVVGDFCLDRYLEIDPTKQEISIETNLPVHNVVNIRSQPGAAGTILNNLVALGIGEIFPVGFAGEDGEGMELSRALRSKAGVNMAHFFYTGQRRTFTYTKPLVLQPAKPPVELNRLDCKNWTPTPATVEGRLLDGLDKLAPDVHGFILLDQVDLPETGVITKRVLQAIEAMIRRHPHLLVLADSRRGLRGYPPVTWKMNAAELATLMNAAKELSLNEAKHHAASLARRQRRNVFVTLAERGIVGASPEGEVEHAAALPVHGEIDIVGAGDAVTANLTAALAAGATVREAIEIANAAASIVIHQLGTTGTASILQLQEVVPSAR
jgi:rfaE bifunctional protein kinase chain/domain